MFFYFYYQDKQQVTRCPKQVNQQFYLLPTRSLAPLKMCPRYVLAVSATLTSLLTHISRTCLEWKILQPPTGRLQLPPCFHCRQNWYLQDHQGWDDKIGEQIEFNISIDVNTYSSQSLLENYSKSST